MPLLASKRQPSGKGKKIHRLSAGEALARLRQTMQAFCVTQRFFSSLWSLLALPQEAICLETQPIGQ
ncbi:hypothetical protein CKO32_07835 [Afifella marina DSM 2698]|nr:hypothetical protein [Afifella marina DSM 2698]MBK1626465.1 hypothetical protein [Afifella marina]MBK5916014.1 hypothetical protein [Afifella marina]RAI18376.1 hypothetical protein CH311_15705 [Afifella marina DSM 2698]